MQEVIVDVIYFTVKQAKTGSHRSVCPMNTLILMTKCCAGQNAALGVNRVSPTCGPQR